jgi:sphingosine kinase
VAQQLPLDYDCIVAVSGDGLIHECLNGLADRPDAEDALKIPIAPIPAGSANALCVNVLGIAVCYYHPYQGGIEEVLGLL